VLLLHDIHASTAQALPMLFKELKAHGYRIVHVVAASAEHPKTATLPSEWLMRPSKDPAIDSWPRSVADVPANAALPRLPAPDEHVFGIGRPFEIVATVASPLELQPAVLGRGKKPAPWPRRTSAPSILDLVSREELPAFNPDSFGYANVPTELPPPSPQKRAAVPAPAFAELRPPLRELPDVTSSIGGRSGTWPATTATIPRAGFP
jgi:peptidoglycan-N-acetylglucosamine deacetylase